MADRPLLGILLMLGFCTVAPLADSMAKLIGTGLPLLMVLVARFGFQVILLLPLALVAGQPLVWSPRIMGLVSLRTLLHVLGIGTMFLSLRFLPLADAIAIAFVMPFILLLLGRFVLGEEVGMRRILACTVGFLGTLLVIQPSFAAIGPSALLPLIVAVVFAAFILVTRQISRVTEPIALQVTSGAIALAVLVPLLLIGHATGLPEMGFTWPTEHQFGLLAAVGVLGTLGHLLMTWSLRFAPASTLAPMQYLEIPVAAALGWAIFSDFPNGMALAGICVTVAAGLYIVFRERALSRA
jgi:drug/metabolite transporter (DMT)-like permease